MSATLGLENIAITGFVYFVIGLAVGAIIKHTIKLALILVFAIIILIVVGYVSTGALHSLSQVLAPELTAVKNDLGAFAGVSTALFAIGLALGLWKG